MFPRINRLAFLAAVIAGMCWSQTNFGRISGAITDSSGAAVPNCTVSVTNPATGQKLQTQTDTAGLFVFPTLQAGSYDLRVQHEGFRSFEQNGLVLDAASSTTPFCSALRNPACSMRKLYVPAGRLGNTNRPALSVSV